MITKIGIKPLINRNKKLAEITQGGGRKHNKGAQILYTARFDALHAIFVPIFRIFVPYFR